MDITALKMFFMWCTIINVGILLVSLFMCIFLKDFLYQLNNKCFSISSDAFNAICCLFVSFYKMLIIIFNIVPLIALMIIT